MLDPSQFKIGEGCEKALARYVSMLRARPLPYEEKITMELSKTDEYKYVMSLVD